MPHRRRRLGRPARAGLQRRPARSASMAGRRRRASSTCRPCRGRTTGSPATTTTTTASTPSPWARAPRSRPRAAAPTAAPSAPRRISATATAAARLGAVVEEVARLQAQGVEYVYFIDEIFLPNRPLLEALVGRGLKFGVQTRIDLWKPEMLELLGRAGCVSIEAGVESLTREGRDALPRTASSTPSELADRLVAAKRHVPFVQANLLEMPQDDEDLVATWRAAAGRCRRLGQRSRAAVPLSGLARLPPAVGPARRPGLGARGRPLSRAPSPASASCRMPGPRRLAELEGVRG